MTRSLAILLLSVLLFTPAMAQDDRLDELGFEETTLKDEPIPYFAVGVGPVLSIAFPNLDEINTRATGLGLDEVKTPMLQWGVEIFTAIGIVPNVRVGFSWITGSLETSKDMTLTEGTVNRAMTYTIGQRTIHADYAIVPAKGLAILPGLGFGWGTQTIASYQGVTNRTWSDYDSISTAPDAFSELEHGVLYLVPRVNLEYALTPFIGLRAQAAYTWQFSSGTWKGNRTSNVSDVPEGVNVSAFAAQIGVFVGLFN